jgi:hypothetical protein
MLVIVKSPREFHVFGYKVKNDDDDDDDGDGDNWEAKVIWRSKVLEGLVLE